MRTVLLSGSPILDVDATLLIYIAVFFVLFFILRAFIFNPVMALFDEREKAIDGAKRDARKLEKDAESKLNAFEDEMSKMRKEASAERDRLRVVADQVGCPTSARDLAAALLALATADLVGTFHLAGTEQATWHEFAVAIFHTAGLAVEVDAITTAEYPTPAPRPANSRLDSGALAEATGIRLPGWRSSLPPVIDEILTTDPIRTSP